MSSQVVETIIGAAKTAAICKQHDCLIVFQAKEGLVTKKEQYPMYMEFHTMSSEDMKIQQLFDFSLLEKVEDAINSIQTKAGYERKNAKCFKYYDGQKPERVLVYVNWKLSMGSDAYDRFNDAVHSLNMNV